MQRISNRHIKFNTYVSDEVPLLAVRIYHENDTRYWLFFNFVDDATFELGAVPEIHHCKPSQIDVAIVRRIRRTQDSPR